MGVPASEVCYNSATARRGDHESSYEHVVALEKKNDVTQRDGFRQKFIVFLSQLSINAMYIICDILTLGLFPDSDISEADLWTYTICIITVLF